jgi:outer membrane protein assembly factor BamB
MKSITTLCAAGLLTLSAGAASATELLALSADGKLFKVDVASLKVTASMNVSGASDLRGLDMRPASGQVYLLGGTDQLYTLDAASGKATAGSKLQTALPGSGQAVVDFNPVADRLRLMSPDGTNLRVNVDTGEAAVDGKLAYAADGPYAGKQATVVAGAYTNSYAGTKSTALYNIDLASGSLMLQNPPNDGVQQEVGKIADGLEAAAMDIVSDGKGGNTAYVLTGKTLHQLDLTSGKPTTLGDIADLPEGIIDIAALPAK